MDNKNSNDKFGQKSETWSGGTGENDPFEEFEFKPLTEGLGFHAKNQAAKKSTEASQGAGYTMGTTTRFTTEKKSTITSMAATGSNGLNKVEFKTSSLNFENTGAGKTAGGMTNGMGAGASVGNIGMKSPMQSPLPRPTANSQTRPGSQQQNLPRRSLNNQIPTIQDDSIAKAQVAVNDILKNLNHKKQQEDMLAKTKKRLTWKEASPSMIAAGLDAMLVLAGFLISLIAMLSITKIDLLINLSNPDQNYTLWMATAFLFASVHMIYMVVFRAYLGYTPGEWAFDQRCGTETQQASYTYIFKVIMRSLIVTATGYFPITLISAIMGKDLLAGITGTQIQTQSYTQLHA